MIGFMDIRLPRSEWLPHLLRAVELLGGQAALARAVGAAQPTVWEWVHKRRTPLRVEVVLRIEAETKKRHPEDAVTRHHLRPDVFGAGPAREEAA